VTCAGAAIEPSRRSPERSCMIERRTLRFVLPEVRQKAYPAIRPSRPLRYPSRPTSPSRAPRYPLRRHRPSRVTRHAVTIALHALRDPVTTRNRKCSGGGGPEPSNQGPRAGTERLPTKAVRRVPHSPGKYAGLAFFFTAPDRPPMGSALS
jgi:hypothetical protein